MRPSKRAPESRLTDGAPSLNVYTGDQAHFPVYEATPEELAARRRARGEADEIALDVHYDAAKELRDRGAAHRVLAHDAATRARQQAAFREEHARIEAEKLAEAARRADARTDEQRKRDERLALVEANRQKVLAKRKAMLDAGSEPAAKRAPP